MSSNKQDDDPRIEQKSDERNIRHLLGQLPRRIRGGVALHHRGGTGLTHEGIREIDVERGRSAAAPSKAAVESVDPEGETSLRGGGTSGGIYHLFGTMENVSGALDLDGNAEAASSGDSKDAGLLDHASDHADFHAARASPSADNQKVPINNKRKKSVTFSGTPSEPPYGSLYRENEKGYGSILNSASTTLPGSSLRSSNRFSVFNLFSGRSLHDSNDARDKTVKGWGIVRAREMSILLFGQRLLSDEEGEEDSDGASDLSKSERENERHEKKTERLLKMASEHKKLFSLTVAECLAAIATYLGLSVLAYSFAFEHWSVIDSLYFGVVTFTSVGYGGLVPSTNSGRLFCAFYALGGVAFLGAALGVLGDKIISRELQAVKAMQSHRNSKVMDIFEQQNPPDRGLKRNSSFERPAPIFRPRFFVLMPMTFLIMLGTSFIMLREGWNNDKFGWNFVSGLYFTVVTMCTIGYGDFEPETSHSRGLAVFFIPFSCAFLGAILARIARAVIDKRQDKFRQSVLQVHVSPDMFEAMDSNADGHVTKADYIHFMLLAMQAVDKDLLDALDRQFDRLDMTQSGDLTVDDLKERIRANLKTVKKKLELSEYKRDLLEKRETTKRPAHQ